MSNQTKFTIIIPTRDRCDTLAHTIETAIAQDYDNYKILVSDNASQDNTKNLVTSVNDSRIEYINTGTRVSMSHNWEFALGHVDDGWITVLGDDDAILPGALLLADKIIKETGTLALRSNGCSYSWPTLLGGRHGDLSISLEKGYRTMRSGEALAKVMRGDLHYNNLPVLYNGGFIHYSLVQKAKSITGNFFLSMTPDVYSALVFAMLTDEYIYSNEPLAINGASHHSGGTAGFEKEKRKRSYDPMEKFWKEKNIPFHTHLPLSADGRPVRSIAAIVYEAYLQASPFHYFKQLTICPEQQLELILKTAEPHADEVRQWGGSFAKQHKLDYEEIQRKAFSITNSLIRKRNNYFQVVNSLTYNFSVNSSYRVPLINVYEASVIAGLLMENRPSILRRLFGMLNQVIFIFKSKFSK